MQCTSETVSEVADDTMLEPTNSDKNRNGDQTQYEYYCIHCPLETDEHGPTITHGNALREHQVRRHNLAPVSWILDGRVRICQDCGERYLTKNNWRGSRDPHPKHATEEEKSRWIIRNLSKKESANTFALEREYGYPSSRAKGKKKEFRGSPHKYRQWQNDQDERWGYLPEVWNALRPKKQHIEPTNGNSKKTNGHATAGPSGKSTRGQRCSVTDMSEETSSEASRSVYEGTKLGTQTDVAHDSLLATAEFGDMLQYATESSAYPMQSDAGTEVQMPALEKEAVEEKSSWTFQDLQCEVRPPVLLSEELMAQMALGSLHSSARYFTADDVHDYQDMVSRGNVPPLSHDHMSVLFGIQLIPYKGRGLAPRSSDADLRKGWDRWERRRSMSPRESSTRHGTPLSLEVRDRQNEGNVLPMRQSIAHEGEVRSKPDYSMSATDIQMSAGSRATEPSTPFVSSSAVRGEHTSAETSHIFRPSMQSDLVSFTGQWMCAATASPDSRQNLLPQSNLHMQSNQQNYDCTNPLTMATTPFGHTSSKDHQSVQPRSHRQKNTRTTCQQGVSKTSSASLGSRGRHRMTGTELARSGPPHRRHTTARMQSHQSAYTHNPQTHRQSFSGFAAALLTDSETISDATRPTDAHQEISEGLNTFPGSSGAQAQWQPSGSAQISHTPRQSTMRPIEDNQFLNAYGHEPLRPLPTVQDVEMLDLGASTPGPLQEDSDLSRSIMSSTLSNFSISTPSALFTEGQNNHNTPALERDNDYQHEVLQTLPAMPPAPQPRPAMLASNSHDSRKQSFNPQQMVDLERNYAPMFNLNSEHSAHDQPIPEGGYQMSALPSSNQVPDPASMDFQRDMDQHNHGLANTSHDPRYASLGYPFWGPQAHRAQMNASSSNIPMMSPEASQYSATPSADGQHAMPGQAANMSDTSNVPCHTVCYTRSQIGEPSIERAHGSRMM